MIKLSKEIIKKIEKEEYYTKERFLSDAKCYIKAVESGRILYTVTHVSNSGMSRNINVKSFEGKMSQGYYRQYSLMFKILGYSQTKNYDLKISGCGMDMVWNTNYNTIKSLQRLGFLSKKRSDTLSQKVNG
jgi:hypothetical protein